MCFSICPFVYWPLYCLFVYVLLCRPLFIFLSFLFLGHYIVCLSVYYCVDRCLSFCLFVSWPDNIVAKKQKDKKINNGWHNNTHTNRQYNGQEPKRQKNKLLFLGHYIVCLSVYYCVDRCLSFCLFVSWPLYCLFVCVLLCRPLFIFLSFYFLAIILSVCLCIIVSTVVRQKDKQRLTQ
jgi:hypothetical protein